MSRGRWSPSKNRRLNYSEVKLDFWWIKYVWLETEIVGPLDWSQMNIHFNLSWRRPKNKTPNRIQIRPLKIDLESIQNKPKISYFAAGEATIRKRRVDQLFRGFSRGKGFGNLSHGHFWVYSSHHQQSFVMFFQIGHGANIVHLDIVGQPTQIVPPKLQEKHCHYYLQTQLQS